jgi:branched-chain amino acid transport system substrate-binding protein
MKKTWIGISLIIIVALIVVLVIIQTGREPKDIEIGAILPLTGSSAQYGQWSKNGAELAVDEINRQGGIKGRKVKIIYEDSRTDAKEGVSALNNLSAIYKVQAIISESSGVVLAIAPVVEEKKIVQLNIGAVNPQIRKAGDYTFSNINDADIEAYEMAEYAYNKLGIRKLAILYATTSYGKGNRDAIKEKFKSIGGIIVADESFDENSGDFRTQIIKIRETAPDAIYVVAVTKDAALILRQARELGIKTQLLSATFFEGKDLLDIAGNAAEGTIYTSTVLNATSHRIQDFIANYRNKYGLDPEIYSATAYDAIHIYALAIGKVGYYGEEIKKYMYTIENYPGISGLTSFDVDGAVEKPILFKKVINGKFEYINN